jgi:hypothetical protein
MITEAAPTQDLLATITNARLLGTVSFEEGCAVLDAIELFDRRTASGKLGTWLEYSAGGWNALRFVPATDTQEDRRIRHRMCEKLAQDVVTWTSLSSLKIGESFTAWVVIDRATRAVWVECSPVKDKRPLHPRALHGASEFPSSSRGTVSVHTFLRVGAPWRDVSDSVTETYYEAKDLLAQFESCDHSWAQNVDAAPHISHEAVDLHVTAEEGSVSINPSNNGPQVTKDSNPQNMLPRRASRKEAERAIRAFLRTKGFRSFEMAEDGEEAWAFWPTSQPHTTSYYHANGSVEWYGQGC